MRHQTDIPVVCQTQMATISLFKYGNGPTYAIDKIISHSLYHHFNHLYKGVLLPNLICYAMPPPLHHRMGKLPAHKLTGVYVVIVFRLVAKKDYVYVLKSLPRMAPPR